MKGLAFWSLLSFIQFQTTSWFSENDNKILRSKKFWEHYFVKNERYLWHLNCRSLLGIELYAYVIKVAYR